MKSYFIRQDNKPQGPYSIDQLKEMKLNPAVLVWVEGLKQWIKALEIPELQQELFPPLPHVAGQMASAGIKAGQNSRVKKGVVIWKNLKTILAVIALILATLLLIELKKSKRHTTSVKTVNPATNTAVSQPSIIQATKMPSQGKKDTRQLEAENPAAYKRYK